MYLFVLAGGFGTRLRSIVSDVPKPLAPVMGKAFITHLVAHWMDQGVKEFVFLLHYEASQIESALEEMSSIPKFSGVNFKTITEESPLGTGGSILHAIKKLGIEGSFLVANADTWLGSGVSILSKEPPCALVAVNVPNCQRYGSLQIEGSIITQFKEKSNSIGQGYVSSGLYHLSSAVFDEFEAGTAFSLEESIFPKLVTDRQLRAVKLDASFIDIGMPDDYVRFCNWIELGKKIEL